MFHQEKLRTLFLLLERNPFIKCLTLPCSLHWLDIQQQQPHDIQATLRGRITCTALQAFVSTLGKHKALRPTLGCSAGSHAASCGQPGGEGTLTSCKKAGESLAPAVEVTPPSLSFLHQHLDWVVVEVGGALNWDCELGLAAELGAPFDQLRCWFSLGMDIWEGGRGSLSSGNDEFECSAALD